MNYIHTTHTIIPYVDGLDAKYSSKNRKTFHFLDESILLDIKEDRLNVARMKIVNLVDGAVLSGANTFMITCTAAGGLIKDLDQKYQKIIKRIESASVEKVVEFPGRVGIVYTNPPVWGQIATYMRELGVAEQRLTPCFVPGAFERILVGDVKRHDELISNFLRERQSMIDCYYLAQVSICAAKERITARDISVPVVSMAELGIMQLYARSPICS